MKTKFLASLLGLALAGCMSPPATRIPTAAQPQHYDLTAVNVQPRDAGEVPLRRVKLTPTERAEIEAKERSAALATALVKQQRRRDDYLAQNPSTASKIVAAIRAGELVAGMGWEEAQASLGHLGLVYQSDGVGGSFDVWSSNAEGFRTELYFDRGRLVRWSRTMN